MKTIGLCTFAILSALTLQVKASIIEEIRYGLLLLDSTKVFDIDEIVVVSQPKEVFKLRMQPASSTSFSGKDIDKLGIRDLRDLSTFTPSFSMPNYGSRLTSSMYIRGIGSRINSPAVGIYIDEMPIISKCAYNFYTYNVDRIDVIRGPQGTLYGQNVEGGLLKMYTKNPLNNLGTDIKLSAGTDFYRNVEVIHCDKIYDDLAYSIAAFYNGTNGFLRNKLTGERADKMNETGGKIRLTYRPKPTLVFDFIADYQYVSQNGFAYGIHDKNNGTTEAPSLNYQSNYRRNMLNSGLSVRLNLNNFTLTSTTTYQFLKDNMLMDQDYTPIDYMHLTQQQFQNAITEEIAIKSSVNKIWRWTFGGFASHMWLKTAAPVYFGDGITKPISNGIQKAMYNSILTAMTNKMIAAGMPEKEAKLAASSAIEKSGGVYANVGIDVPGIFRTPLLNAAVFHESNINVTDKLTATIGLRYDYSRVGLEYETKASMGINASVMGVNKDFSLTSKLQNKEKSNFSQLLPKFGVSYTIGNNNSNVYFVVSKGYRAGGYNIQMFSDILQAELNENKHHAMAGDYDIPHNKEDYEKIRKTILYKPETSWNYEIGTHMNLMNNTLYADMDVFCMDVNNQQLSVMAGNYGFGRMMVNAGKSRSVGFEVALRGQTFAGRLSWGINYGFTHATFIEYKDYVNIDGNNVEQNYKGRYVPYVPRNTFNTNASYRMDINHAILRSLTFGLNLTALGRIYWDECNTFYQPFYAILNGNIYADLKTMGVRFWCRNLTNTKYNTFAINSSATGVDNSFAQRGVPTQMGFDINICF